MIFLIVSYIIIGQSHLTCRGSFGKSSVPNMVSPPRVTWKIGRPMEGRVIVKTFSFIKQMTSITFLELFLSTSNLE